MLEIKNVSYGYVKGYDVLHDFSLTLDEGGVYGLLGKNGTGKSTLLYLIMGLLRPREGSVLFDGKSTALRRPDTMSQLFIVPEEYDLPRIPLRNYVRSIRPFYPRFSDETLRTCLSVFDMDRDVNLGALSMGQKKKVYMCVALATNTRLLVMDEPTNGLDIPSKSQFRKVVATGMTEEKSIVISTHQVRDVELLLDHVVVIDRNKQLLNCAMGQLSERLKFGQELERDVPADALYVERGLGGCGVVSPRHEGDEETPVNLELLFNALMTDARRIQCALSQPARGGRGGGVAADAPAEAADGQAASTRLAEEPDGNQAQGRKEETL